MLAHRPSEARSPDGLLLRTARTPRARSASPAGRWALSAAIPPELTRALAARYDLAREIGRGGMATVYLAHDRKHGRAVALKVLSPDVGASLGPERFLREIHLLARLQHPHVLPLYDSGDADGLLYFVMPFVEGESLRDRLQRDGALGADECARVLRQIADALDYAHARGVVHRDLKPENVLLTSGQALLADFGIAHVAAHAAGAGSQALTMAGVALGTPAYMSPEQASGDTALDSRSDVYSLGCLAYELLAGEPPFRGPTVMAYLMQHITAEPPALVGLRAPLADELPAVIARALAKEPAERYATAGTFADAVEQAVARQRVPTDSDERLRAVERERSQRLAVLVLEFTNVSGATDVDWLATGIAESVSADLRKVGGVRLVAQDAGLRRRVEAMRAGRPIDEGTALAIGRMAGADWVVWGSYQKAGARLRIVPSFTEVARETTHPCAKLDGTMDDVFELQDDIVTALAQRLDVPLTSGEVERIRRPETSSLSAYEHYARGYRAFLEFSKESVRAADEHFREAIALDPAYAPAFVGLGMLHMPMYIASGRAELLAAGEEYLRRGLVLDPTIADGFAFLSYFEVRRGRYADGEVSARRGVELDPASYFSWYMLGATRLLGALMMHDLPLLARAVPPLLRTLTINPNYHAALVLLVEGYQLRGEYGHARRLADTGLALERGHVGLQFVGSLVQRASLAVGDGDLPGAAALLDDAIARYAGADHVYAEAVTAYSHWLRGVVAEREGALDRARAEFERACATAEANPHRISIGAHWVKGRLGLARVLRRTGDAAAAEAALADGVAVFRERSRFIWTLFIGASDASVLYEHASTLADWGRTAEALALLRLASDAGWADLIWLHHDPAFAGLRGTPEVRALGAEAAARVIMPAPVGSGGVE